MQSPHSKPLQKIITQAHHNCHIADSIRVSYNIHCSCTHTVRNVESRKGHYCQHQHLFVHIHSFVISLPTDFRIQQEYKQRSELQAFILQAQALCAKKQNLLKKHTPQTNTVFRKKISSKTGYNGKLEKLHNQESHNFLSSSDTLRVIKSGAMRWFGHVVHP